MPKNAGKAWHRGGDPDSTPPPGGRRAVNEIPAEGKLPELTDRHVNDFADFPEGFLDEHFLSFSRPLALGPELIDAGFLDPRGFSIFL